MTKQDATKLMNLAKQWQADALKLQAELNIRPCPAKAIQLDILYKNIAIANNAAQLAA